MRFRGIILILFFLLGLVFLYRVYFLPPQETQKKIVGKQRILVIAPHSDDETLGPGGIISRALHEGDQVKVVLITNGDGFTRAAKMSFPEVTSKSEKYLRLATLRQMETMEALEILGLPEEQIIYLGYPDAGIAKLWFHHWDADKPYFNPRIQYDYSPYARNYTPGVLYTGQHLLVDLEKIIKSYQPTDIYYPHPNDLHADHWGTNCFIKYLLTQQGMNNIRQHLYLVHRGMWPTTLVLPGRRGLDPPPALIDMGTSWVKFPLTADELERKKEAILMYHSQVRIMRNFLLSFARPNELFGYYPDLPFPNKQKQLLIPDPRADSWQTRTHGDGDITGLYGYQTVKNLYLELETRETPVHALNYEIHLVFLEKGQPSKRADIFFKEGQPIMNVYSQDSLKEIPGMREEFRDRRLYLTLPKSALPSFKNLYLNAESEVGNLLLDKTAWRMFTVE